MPIHHEPHKLAGSTNLFEDRDRDLNIVLGRMLMQVSLAFVLRLAQLVRCSVLGSADASAEPNIAVFCDAVVQHISIWAFSTRNRKKELDCDGRRKERLPIPLIGFLRSTIASSLGLRVEVLSAVPG
jgi:hypothetical protein